LILRNCAVVFLSGSVEITQFDHFKAGVSKLRPAGQMRPAKLFHPSRKAILSMM